MFNYNDESLTLALFIDSAAPFSWLIWNDELQRFEDSGLGALGNRGHAKATTLPAKYLKY